MAVAGYLDGGGSEVKLLDLFCGAGGAAMGYYRAGFEVVGVDIKPQKHFPFEFHQADAFDYLREHGHEFDVIHASPPCQAYSTMTKKWGRSLEHPDLVDVVRVEIKTLCPIYIIENVAGSPLNNPVMLCGSSFQLGVRRHRYFEMSHAPALYPVCQHTKRALAVYGHPGGSSKRDPNALFGSTRDWKAAMGIDWMDATELAQAIPPAYTEYIGKQLLKQLKRK